MGTFVEHTRALSLSLINTRYGVPLHYKFTMQMMQVEAHLDSMAIGSSSAEVVIDASVSEIARDRGILSEFTTTVEFRVDGQFAGRGRAVANVLSPLAYDRARWRGGDVRSIGSAPRPTSVDPSAVGVWDPSAVVLGAHPAGPDRGLWLLRVDVTHPVLFDHPLDHVPGALVLEAARQSARLRAGSACTDVEHLDVRFRRFLELDEPTVVAARTRKDHDCVVDVEFSQWGETKASGTVRLSAPATRNLMQLSGPSEHNGSARSCGVVAAERSLREQRSASDRCVLRGRPVG